MLNELLCVGVFYGSLLTLAVAIAWSIYDSYKTRKWWKEYDAYRESI